MKPFRKTELSRLARSATFSAFIFTFSLILFSVLKH